MNIFRRLEDWFRPPEGYLVQWDADLILLSDSRGSDSIPFRNVTAFGLRTDWAEPWRDDSFLVLFSKMEGEEELRREFSLDHDNVLPLLRELEKRSGLVGRRFGLANCVHPASVFLWPPEKAGLPIWPDYGPAHSIGTKKDYEEWLKRQKKRKGAT